MPHRDASLPGAEPAPSPNHSFAWKVWLILGVVQARLRFILILAAVGGTILYWGTLQAYYEKWTRPLFGEPAAASSDSEYWCPMHPTIIRDHPDKCPICGMPLSKRKKGEAAEADEALPPGVTSRVQLTPYRVALAGIQTVPVDYQPLFREITTVGFVEFDERKLARISARVPGKSRIEKLYVNVTGQMVQKGDPLALLYNPDLVTTAQNLLDARRSSNRDLERMARERLQLWGIDPDQIKDLLHTDHGQTHLIIRSPISGHILRKYPVEGEYVEEGGRLYDVANLSTVWIEAQVYEDELAFLKEGLPVSATTKAFPNREFKGKLTFLHPHLDAATRTLRVRFDMDNPDHDLRPGMYANVTLQVPATRLQVLPPEASDRQKQALERGLVLAVPERAVIDTGSRKLVYRETEPDVYDGVEVELGPRCGAFYPLIRGLQAGDKVATAGSFLIDAETRLTGGVASTYLGVSAGTQAGDRHLATTAARPSLARDEEDKVQAALARLGTEDRQLAGEQGYCPVLGTRLGAMGLPVKLLLQEQVIFLCCKACVTQAQRNPQAALAKVAELKAKIRNTPPVSEAKPGPAVTNPREGWDAKLEAKVKANLAQLSPEDRKLAEAQRFCPNTDDNRLGAMGPPVKVMVKGQPVFVCCKACLDSVQQNPDQTLAKVEQLKATSR
jgi:multidrug efflux pump subunit AcrA (membrane-fusion protein)